MRTKDCISRCLHIVRRLKRGQKASFTDIQRYLNEMSALTGEDYTISIRTFQRDLDAIRELSGSNLDTVWENMTAQVGNIEVEPSKTLDEQIRLNEEREKLQQRIDSFERLARAEKQPRKKFELVQKIKKLGNEKKANSSPTWGENSKST